MRRDCSVHFKHIYASFVSLIDALSMSTIHLNEYVRETSFIYYKIYKILSKYTTGENNKYLSRFVTYVIYDSILLIS